MLLSRRDVLRAAAAAAAAGVLAACGGTAPSATSRPPTTSSPPPPPSPPPATPEPTASPTTSPSPDPAVLRRKIGGLIVAGFRGLEVRDGDPIARAIVENGLGGVVLFDRDQLTGKRRNIASPTQLAELTGRLRELAAGRPLFIAIDQEGGRVARLSPATGFPATPSEAELGERGDVDAALEVGRKTARTLKSAGIDWNFAPVVDLDVNPTNPSIGALGRSFSADPDVVVAMAGAIIRAHRAEGVLTTLKHFPGLGSATGDTDREFVDVTRTWHRGELEPFRRLVAGGLADSVMVANALNGQLDSRLPASLSAATVGGSLRGDVGWDGLVVTDDLQAGAIRDAYGDADTVELALTAGNDVLLFANQQVYVADVVARTIDLVVDLVHQGRIDEARLDESAARVARARGAAGG